MFAPCGIAAGLTIAMVVIVPAALQPRPARPPDIYFTPTQQDVAEQMLALARVSEDDVVYDLGSGDGRIVILAAQKYGARAVGIELEPRLVEISRRVAREGEVADRVTFIEGDLFAADLSQATVVTLYLSPGVNRRLEAKLRRELKPGARIVSHQFGIGTWEPDVRERATDGTDLYLWTVQSGRDEFQFLPAREKGGLSPFSAGRVRKGGQSPFFVRRN